MKKELILFEKAKESKKICNGIVSVVLLYLMMSVGSIIGQRVLFPISMLIGEIKLPMETLGLVLLFLFPLLLCFLWVKVVEKRKISSLGLNKDRFFIKFVKGFIIGILMFSLVTFLMYIFGIASLSQGIKVGVKFIPSILIILLGWIVQSSTEEILTRGWLMHVVGAKHKPIIGLIVSSVIFAFLHILNPGIGIISILNIILIGFMFGLYVIYTQDLWGACGIHAAWNFSQGNIFGFSVSGININTTSLFKFSTNGSNLLTGGEFGPEASIFSTIVITIGTIILLFKLKGTALDKATNSY